VYQKANGQWFFRINDIITLRSPFTCDRVCLRQHVTAEFFMRPALRHFSRLSFVDLSFSGKFVDATAAFEMNPSANWMLGCRREID